jgi:hypothetical protein
MAVGTANRGPVAQGYGGTPVGHGSIRIVGDERLEHKQRWSIIMKWVSKGGKEEKQEEQRNVAFYAQSHAYLISREASFRQYAELSKSNQNQATAHFFEIFASLYSFRQIRRAFKDSNI